MSIIPGLVREMIDYYMWRGRIREVNKEYHERCSEYDLCSEYDEITISNRSVCILWNSRVCAIMYNVGYRVLESDVERNLIRSKHLALIHNFVKGTYVYMCFPSRYMWSDRDVYEDIAEDIE